MAKKTYQKPLEEKPVSECYAESYLSIVPDHPGQIELPRVIAAYRAGFLEAIRLSKTKLHLLTAEAKLLYDPKHKIDAVRDACSHIVTEMRESSPGWQEEGS